MKRAHQELHSRIVIIGNSGSGKSHLARALASIQQAPVIDLDRLFWQPGSFSVKRPEADVTAELDTAAAKPAWIIEGVFGELVQRVLDRADLLVWLDLDRDTCLASIFRRGFTVDDEVQRPEMEASFSRLCRWAEAYWMRDGPRSHAGHLAIFEGFPRTKYRFRQRDDVDAFVATMRFESPVWQTSNP